jgi:DNA-binding LacI/PurR family transcriptional regulator
MKTRPTSVTLRHVAHEAGVSITTVSRILNRKESGVPIREETRQRVISAASELGYKPNLLARGLRGSRSSLLGVIARDISDPFHVQVLRGINDAAHRREHRLFLGHVDYRPDVAAIYGSMFEQSHADGIIVIGDIAGGDATLERLARQHRYVVGVSDRIDRREAPGVYADSVAGTRLAMDHLWGLGHRSIVCVTDPRTADGPLRAEVYETYLREHGAGDQVHVHFTPQPDPEPSHRLGLELFAKSDREGRPTAVYAASDTIAIGILQAAFQAGVKVPEEVSIVGFDDIDMAAFTIPPLTTVSQDGVEMGRLAADLLLDMIDQGRESADVDDVVMTPTLVVRQSTAPLAA